MVAGQAAPGHAVFPQQRVVRQTKLNGVVAKHIGHRPVKISLFARHHIVAKRRMQPLAQFRHAGPSV